MFKQIYLVLTLSVVGTITLIQPSVAQKQTPPPTKTLKVGVAGSPPFVIKTSDQIQGISLELWREIAYKSQLSYQLVPQSNVREGINAVNQGKLDVLIGPISVTAQRLEKVTFTQPYFQSKIGLLVNSESPTLWSRVRPLFRNAILSSLGILLIALFTVGNLLWLTEHRRNDRQFPKAYLPGVANGMWFALVTLTTVGYGDKAPITKSGRTITSIWMLITMVAASSLTAGIAAALTIFLSGETTERFSDPEAIEDARIAIIEGTTGQIWAEDHNARLVKTENLSEAVQQVLTGKAEGVAFDVPALQYYLHQNPKLPLKISSITFATEDYAFALPIGNSLLHELNIDLVALREQGELDYLRKKVLNLASE